ncbi:multidrug ABC transporter permease [Bacillus subtilis]|nr:multidrug ABC transporter permease [Bacillus subtilis]
MNWLKVIKAEIYKQHKNSFHSTKAYFSLLIWPILNLINAYLCYKPFNLNDLKLYRINTSDELISFLLIGFFTYISFKSLMQSALQMSYERSNGTLETIFLSPANRLSLIYGRSLGFIFGNIWMFFAFTFFIMCYIGSIPIYNLVYFPICFILIVISATLWGGLLNTIFLFSRDASILFMIIDDPMMLFSGVRIPLTLFPIWAQVISFIFPLTHVLAVVRDLMLFGDISLSSWNHLLYLLSELLFMFMITLFLLPKAEKHARINGELTFY